MSSFADAECREEHEYVASAPAIAEGFDCHLGDLHVLEVMFRRRCEIPLHAHENARLVFVVSGEVAETYAGNTIACDANSFSFHPEVLPHRNDTGCDDARAVVIELCNEKSRRLLSLVGADVAPFTSPARRLRDTAIELSRAIRSRDAARHLLIESLALDLVVRAARLIELRCDPETAPEFFGEACALIESDIDRGLTLGGLAMKLRVTSRALVNAFRVHGRTTFRSYVLQRRVARAAELLHDDGMPLADVALAAGFCDQSHLTRVFRRVTGMTPMSYRAQSDT